MPEVSYGRRLAALAIDWFIALLTAGAVTRSTIFGDVADNPFWPLLAFFIQVTLLVGLLGFSIGKRFVGLKVEGPDGRPIGLLRAAVRTALLCLVLPAIVQTDDKRGLHDLAAVSRVVRA